MRTVMLDWQQAGWLTVALVVITAVLTAVRSRHGRAVAPFVREAAMITGLYTLWQFAGSLSTTSSDGALARARWIWHAERVVHLPSEVTVQRLVTAQPLLARGAVLYYDTMHFTVMGIFLVWLFTWHRNRYRPVRRVLAISTLACLLVQLVPVAPPRFLPGLGFRDTAVQAGLSVYGGGFDADQLSAMPSVHVAWAVLVGVACLRIARGWWRWLGPAHMVITVLVVVATANHFWADGIVAVALLALAWGLERVGVRVAAAVRSRWAATRPEPVAVPLG